MNRTGKVILGSIVGVVLFFLLFMGQEVHHDHNTVEYMTIPKPFRNRVTSGYGDVPPSTVSTDKPAAAATTENIYPLQPVLPEDWKTDLPTYNVSKEIQSTIWWRAAAFLELDLQTRPSDYDCFEVKELGNWYGCFDGNFQPKKPCLVYSFGIANDFSFDDAMAALGCEVHSFDPSIGKPDHIRENGVHFHPIGLGGTTVEDFNPRHDMYVQDEQKWTIMTLGTIMSLLGHSNRQLDILKIDVEGHEWAVIEYILDHKLTSKIKQFLLEYHVFPDWPLKSEYSKLLSLYKKLHDSGFKKFSTAMHPLNHNPESFNIQADVGYVNMGLFRKNNITKGVY